MGHNLRHATAFHSLPDTAPGFWQLGNLWRILAVGVNTGNSLCLIDQLVSPNGGGPTAHLLAGEAKFLLNDRREVARAGSLVFIPRGTAHRFRTGAAGARFLTLCTPAGFECAVTTLGEPAKARTGGGHRSATVKPPGSVCGGWRRAPRTLPRIFTVRMSAP